MEATEDRPLEELVSAAVDAAHAEFHARKQPMLATEQYAMFEWFKRNAAESYRAVLSNAAAHNTSCSKTPKPGASASGCDLGEAWSMAEPSTTCISGGGLDTATSVTWGNFDDRVSESDSVGAPVEDAGLEVTCQYDTAFQTASAIGKDGVVVRPQPSPQIGPVAFLFRWYTKRATQFPAGFPRPGDLPDAPPLPPADGGHCGGGPPPQRKQQKHGTSSNEAGAVGDNALQDESGSGSGSGGTHSVGRHGRRVGAPKVPGSPAAGAWNEGLPPRGGRALNRAPDPVMSLCEFREMLEELEVVPQMVSRQDVLVVFRTVARIPCVPPNRLEAAQTHPDEMRYPQFCDALVRIALVADALDARAAGATSRQPRPVSDPAAAVAAFMETIGVSSANMSVFKRKLDSLARMVSERGARRAAIKHLYMSPRSAVDAARASVAPMGPDGWTVDTPAFAPPALLDLLQSSDVAASGRYHPGWYQFPAPALDLGAVNPGELRCLRVVLRNRGQYAVAIRVDTTGAAENLVATFNETTLPPGVPRVIDIEARFNDAGEYTGSLRVFSRARGSTTWRLTSVPFYALVGTPDPAALFPASKGERRALSVKSYAKPSARSMAAALSQGLQSPPGTMSCASGSLAGMGLPDDAASIAATSGDVNQGVNASGSGVAGIGSVGAAGLSRLAATTPGCGGLAHSATAVTA